MAQILFQKSLCTGLPALHSSSTALRPRNGQNVRTFSGFVGCPNPAYSSRVFAMSDKPSRPVQEEKEASEKETVLRDGLLTSAVALAPFLLDPQEAFAQNREYGILEGQILSLVHPVVMGLLLVLTLWAGYLGWQWRRVRTIQDDVNELKKQLPAKNEDGTVPPSPIDAKIKELQETRKELVKVGYRDQHFNAGSLLLGTGVTIALAGVTNTYLRTGRLFPGPHLYAGGGIIALWAIAASLVPAMQKGNDTARSLHIGANVLNLALFLWQVPTGLEIVYKVLEFATLP